jgi:HK97 family phage major capsid protein
MLVVITPRQDRIKCLGLERKIEQMHKKAMDDTSVYSQNPCPRTVTPKGGYPVQTRISKAIEEEIRRQSSVRQYLAAFSIESSDFQKLQSVD